MNLPFHNYTELLVKYLRPYWLKMLYRIKKTGLAQ